MNGEIRKAMKKIFKLLLLVLAVCALYLFLICVFHEQCKDIARWYIVHEVKENQETLEDAVGHIAEMDTEHITSKKIPELGICYKELNNDSVTKAFKKLNLFYIENRIDNQSRRMITFHPKIDRGLFLNISALFTHKSVECGFYYSEDDVPIDVFYTQEECEEEFEGKLWGIAGNYHYQTERIASNWWYYEVAYELTYGVSGRR